MKKMFMNCLIDTLDSRNNPAHGRDSTIDLDTGDNTTYIVTGDIDGMWLRDSCAQVHNYVYMCKDDTDLKDIIRGTIRRHMKHLNLTNKHAKAALVNAWWSTYEPRDYATPTGDYKLESDGLPYVIRLSWLYWKITGDTSWTNNPGESQFSAHSAFNNALELFVQEQNPTPENYNLPPVQYTGLVWCSHRPSDDECVNGYLVPANMFIAAWLPKLKEIYTNFWPGDTAHINMCQDLFEDITNGISAFAVYDHPTYGKIWAYEVDGYGNYLLMDDANVPSLLSAPYIGFCSNNDPIYKNTRNFLLHTDNPEYFSGVYYSGIGSPHTPDNRAWPMAVAMQALTSDNPVEIQTMLEYLTISEAGKRYMHEGVDVDNPGNFSRPWFTWPDSLYGEVIIKKVLGLNYYPEDGEVYVKPFLNKKSQYAKITNDITFGNKVNLKIQSYGTNSNITSATLNGGPVAPDPVKGVKINADNDGVIIHTVPAYKNYHLIDLSGYVNQDAVSWDWNRMDSSRDGSFDAYYLNLQDHQLFSAHNGIGFKVGSWNDGDNNIIGCANQMVNLNNLMASNIYIFGWAENEDQTGVFKINYSDGNYYEVIKSFSDWIVSAPQYDEEYTALIMGHRQHKVNEDEVINGKPVHIFQYKIPVAYFKELTSIKLPYNENIRIFAITLAGIVSLSQPNTPAWVSAIPVSEYQINLLWNDVSNETSYTLFRNLSNSTDTAVNTAGVSYNITNYSDTTLVSNTKYFFWLKAYNSLGSSGFSAVISNTTLPLSPPVIPQWISAEAVSPSQINLTWKDTSNETNYKLFSCTSNNTNSAVLRASISMNITNYNDLSLIPGTAYFYWLKTWNSLGSSGFSAVTTATTLPLVEDGTFRFAVMSDSQGSGTPVNITVFSKLSEKMSGHYPVKLFFPGDLINGQSTSYPEFINEFAIWKSVITNYIPLTNCMAGLGNHEDGWGTKPAGERAFNDSFSHLPDNQLAGYGRTVYYYDYVIPGAKARFIMLNSEHTNESSRILSAQRNWLEARLSEADTLGYHTIIFYHEPAYPTGAHSGSALDKYAVERDALWQIIDNHNVGVVFSGHEHNYSRRHVNSINNPGYKNSIYQIIEGGSGGSLNGTYTDTLNVDVPPVSAHHYVIGKIEGEYINIYVYTTNNSLVDQFQIYRNKTPKTVTDKLPKPVIGYNFSQQGNVNNISWVEVNMNSDNTAAQGASGISYYNIYRSETLGEWLKIGTSSNTSYNDTVTNSSDYYYKINAVNKAWKESIDWGYVHSSSKIIVPLYNNSTGNLNVKMVLAQNTFNILLKDKNKYNKNLWIGIEDIPAEKDFVDSYEIKILQYSDDAPVEDLEFDEEISIDFYYNVNSLISTSEANEAGINSRNIDQFLKVFRHNGIEWINQGGVIDKENNRIALRTKKTGKYTLKIQEHAAELELIQLEPKKIFTPYGEPPHNEMRFYFENPENKQISCIIYSLKGRKIKELPVKMNSYNEGYYYWDGKDENKEMAASGVYIYQLKSNEKTINGSLLLAK
ncbi:MAG: glycoside hydrolase family 125 protein [Spirochaetes bacterium]|nr:glycoside hydrolase family 125 protein [Spirochaetota bacterium]